MFRCGACGYSKPSSDGPCHGCWQRRQWREMRDEEKREAEKADIERAYRQRMIDQGLNPDYKPPSLSSKVGSIPAVSFFWRFVKTVVFFPFLWFFLWCSGSILISSFAGGDVGDSELTISLIFSFFLTVFLLWRRYWRRKD